MMYPQKKGKSLLLIIGVLLLANIVGLVFFFMDKQSHKKESYATERKNAMLGYLKNDIGFTAAQLAAYDSLTAQHYKNMEPLYNQLKKEKETRLKYISLYQYADTAITTAVNKTMLQQQVVETKMLLYLKSIRIICSAEQQIKFDSSIYKMFGRRGGDRKK